MNPFEAHQRQPKAKRRPPPPPKRRRPAYGIDYRYKTEMPIRDMWQDGKIIFVVTVYGWTGRDVCIIPGGSDPFIKAVERLGLDPMRYQAVLWDAEV